VVEVLNGFSQRQASFLEQVVEGEARAFHGFACEFHDEPEICPEESLPGVETVLDDALQCAAGVASIVGCNQMCCVDTCLDFPGKFPLLLSVEQWARENQFCGVHVRNAAIVSGTGPVSQADRQHQGKK
jgi:hypothetical protein